MLDSLIFLAGLVLLVVGAEGMVRGATVLAGRLGVPTIIIGLTVVAVGTSAPELVVAIVAAVQGHPGIVFGNVVGSNILNILIVLGATSLVAPFLMRDDTARQDLPWVAMLSMMVFLMALDGRIGRIDGAILLVSVPLYIRGLRQRPGIEASVSYGGSAPAILAAIAGLVLLVVGARLVVDGGTGLAVALGVPTRVVALTFVALGTSAPELATAVIAARRNQVDLAVGNVVGSNILNLGLVLGVGALITPIPVPSSVLRSDLMLMVATMMVLYMLLLTSSRRRVGRRAGAVLLLAYAVYVVGLFGGLGQ